ncbi:hypothetical protein Cni_G18764 [Canna indica]|uniref:Aminotransferase-like plant mobile domain-containing protein n=1 Tax=Canna indica TaxID=4628 RepID=A0AAQ3KLA2_9LILI|nr:hypothetical protein Cni_G18764 [Canna indica]
MTKKIFVRCFLTPVNKFLTERIRFTDAHLRLLEQTPFWQYTTVPANKMDTSLVNYLLENWEDQHCAFRIKDKLVPITIGDVAIILGFKSYGESVTFQRSKLKSTLQQEHFDGQPISRSALEKKIIELQHSDDLSLFTKMVILYFFCTIFFPQKNYTIPEGVVKYAENLEGLNQYNWAKAIHSFLVKHINYAHKQLRNKSSEVVLGGCSIVLNVWFYEHTPTLHNELGDALTDRPRLFRWSRISFRQKRSHIKAVENLKFHEILEVLDATENEYHLLQKIEGRELAPRTVVPVGANIEEPDTDYSEAREDETDAQNKKLSKKFKKIRAELQEESKHRVALEMKVDTLIAENKKLQKEVVRLQRLIETRANMDYEVSSGFPEKEDIPETSIINENVVVNCSSNPD